MRFFISLCILASFLRAGAQHANHWLFGNHASLNFNTTPPTPVSGGQTNNVDNSSAISDANGNLLFYTDGMSVWNSSNSTMPNGTGLVGHMSAGQCAVIVPIPCHASQYVIFHNTEFSNPGYLNYTVVDMSLNNGSGDVVATQKNVSLGSGWTEKICAYYNASANSYWVLVHKWNSNQFVAFNVSASGIATQSVVSSVGSVHNCGSYGSAHDAMGQLTISPDGTKVLNALTCQDKYELFDFNAATGTLSNPISIPGSGGSAWGTAFSPDSKKIYVNTIFGDHIYQYDISSNNQTSILGSAYVVLATTSSGYNYGYMELGPDGKLYIGKPNTSFLAVVNTPNNAGAACSFSPSGLSLGSQSSNWGLSRIAYNIPPGSNATLSVTVAPSGSVCAGNTVTLSVASSGSYSWNPGGTGSVIVVAPANTTTYNVTGSLVCNTASASAVVNVWPLPNVSVSGKGMICKGETENITASGASSYSWSTGQSSASISVSPGLTTTYSVTGTSADGCVNQVLYTVSVSLCDGIQDHSVQASVVIYPNPAHDELWLELPSGNACQIAIVNAYGSLIRSFSNSPGEHLKLDLSAFETGIYFVQVKSSTQTTLHKFVKE